MVEKKQWMRSASSGDGKIFSRLWVGEEKRAVLQIAHGMAEHSARYDDFACFMAEHGYVICMNDHAGHGPYARTKGHFSDKDGWEHVVQDMKNLMDEVSEQYQGLPVFLMGHSMGSFLSRSYIIRNGGLTGCVLAGTMGYNGGLRFGRMLAIIQKKLKGPKSRGKFLDKLGTGNYNKRISNPVNNFAWLSTVDEVCIAYEEDEYCGFEFTAAGYYDMCSGLMEINSSDWAAKVPKDLPLYLLAGDDDPVGNYGKGPREVYDALVATGHDAQLKLYPGKRHEMLNESNRQEVYNDVLDWLDKHIS
ncbi:alpha/beta fold hydrolase [Alkaliphilus sp. B6464]|uniref:alpha/beta fold hydrolase n=1 Tax=Alkaliphilus sp. B6464 TaxID=2731219 RepID=UPI001BAC2E87|nr:alpha/beta fold hydrolase [Alkaliphilus sp. B6464]QUH18451.1 alpha/beta hydrolase [Alkaliphilus sp. B6464]